ncbi:MAG: hypothetical protein JSS98_18010 [Bacteroidetes bacterium]|nr:hypothetical protein [Bacteroidota bacterium]
MENIKNKVFAIAIISTPALAIGWGLRINRYKYFANSDQSVIESNKKELQITYSKGTLKDYKNG